LVSESEKARYPEKVTARVSREIKDQVEALAGALNQTPSTWLRLLIEERLSRISIS